jgi:replication factor A1
VCSSDLKGEYGISFVAEKAWVPEEDLAVRVVKLLHRLGPAEEDGQERNSQVPVGGIDLA